MLKNTFIIFISISLFFPNISLAQNRINPDDMNKIMLTNILAGSATCLVNVGVNYLTNYMSDKAQKAREEAEERLKKEAEDFAAKAAVNATSAAVGLGYAYVNVTNTRTVEKRAQDAVNSLISKEACWDGLARGVAQNLLQSFSNNIISLANTGFDGNPVYIRNIDDFMDSVTKQKLNHLMPDIQTKNPVFGNALRSILTDQINLTSNDLILSANNTEVGKQYNEFINDFTRGGWGSLLNTQNNPLSAMFGASNEIYTNIINEKLNLRDEYSRGNGFLDIKQCIEYDKNDKDLCIKYATTTPGKLISDQVSLVIGSPIRQLETVDEIDEIVHAFFANLINKILGKDGGLFSAEVLSGDFGGTNWGSNLTFSDGVPIRPTINMEMSTGFSNIDIQRPQLIREAIIAQINFKNRAQDHIYANFEELYELGRLDYCMPGPNPRWDSSRSTLAQNIELFSENSIDGLDTALLKKTSDKLIGNNYSYVLNNSYENFLQYASMDGANRSVGLFKPFKAIDSITGKEKSITFEKGIAELPAQKNIQGIYTDIADVPGNPMITSRGMMAFTSISPIYNKNVIRFFMADKLLDRYALGNFIYSKVLKNSLKEDFESKYSIDKIITIFKEHNPNVSITQKALYGGMTTQAYEHTERLIPRAQEIYLIQESLNEEINEENGRTTQNIVLLNQLYQEVQDIVEPAKARYIAERAAAGDPVDMQCIDAAYVIDRSPITVPLDSDATPRNLNHQGSKYNKLNQNRIYFDSTL